MSYLEAALAAKGILKKRKADTEHHPAGSAWSDFFVQQRPPGKSTVVATIELLDGRKVTGAVRGWTPQLEDSREIALVGPLAVTTPRGQSEKTNDDFMIIREEHLLYVSGHYVAP